jgi:chromosome segregation protein
MHLKSLSISGFKSFASRSELEFAPGITAVVGPNGSGKSNVADAIRWVLGEQSTGKLRGKRGEDLIFAGSEGRKQGSMAEVTLILDNSDGRAPIPAAEISLTRRLYRSGESEYLLGGKPVRLLDVVTLLAEAGFGQSTYTVISQGMIDQLLLGTAAERKALFDEAVGVRGHYLKRDQSVRRLSRTRENLEQVKILIRELEPTLTSLGRSAKRAAERGEVESKFQESARLYYGARLGALETSLSEVTKGQAESEVEAERLEREIASLEARQTDLSAPEDPELESERRILRELLLERDELSRKLAVSSGRLQAAKEESGDVELRSALDALERLRSELARREGEQGELRTRLERVDTSLKAATAERDRLRERQDKLRADVTRLEEAVTVPESRALLGRLRETLKAMQSAAPAELPAHLKEAEAVLVELERSLDPAPTSELSAIRAQLREGEAAARRADAGVQELSSERASVSSLLLAVGERLTELGAEITALEVRAKSLEQKDVPVSDVMEREHQTLVKELGELEVRLTAQRETVAAREGGLQGRMRELGELRGQVSEKQNLARHLAARSTELQVERAKLETRLEDLKGEIMRELGAQALVDLPRQRITGENLSRAEAELSKLRNKLAQIGTVDPETSREHDELKARVDHLSEQSRDLEAAATDLERIVSDLETLIRRQFSERFRSIAKEFQTRFAELFGGGKAEITLESGEEGELGIEIRATPPGKRLSEIHSLSGGERALTSAALLCAILTVNPSPFVVLDEVDAALDEANTVKFGKVVASLAHHTQFILITHNRRTMELASVLYGVTMDEGGVSRLLSLKLEQAEELAEEPV